MKMRLYKKIVFLSAIIFISEVSAYSTDGTFSKSSLTSAPYLRIESDVKSVGLAGVFTAVPLTGSIINPANSAFESKRVVAISYRQHILDIRGGTLFFGSPIKNIAVLSGSFNYLSNGEISNLKDYKNMSIDGVFKPYTTIFSLSFSRLFLDNFALGFTAKGMYEKINNSINSEIGENSSKGLVFDIGWQYRNLKKRLIYGIVFQDLGLQNLSYLENGYEIIPFTLNTGLSFQPSVTSKTLIAVDLSKSMNDYLKVKLGLDIDIFRGMAFIRTGFKFSSNDVRGVISNISSTGSQGASISTTDGFTKSNWSLLSLGLGIKSIKKERNIEFNTAVELRVKGIPPSVLMSLSYSF